MSNESINRRVHLRYRDPESTVYRFSIEKDDSSETLIGLVANESHNGIACVAVGSGDIQPGELIHWHETENIKTPCRVVRCIRLDEDVFRLALSIEGIK